MVYAFGESLIDIIVSHDGRVEAKPGGSMLNVAVSLARAGKAVSMITEIGHDDPGGMLTDFLVANGIDTRYVNQYRKGQTALAFATLDRNRKPSYTFYKRYPQQRSLVVPEAFSAEDVFVFGSMYSRDPAIKDHIALCLERARKGRALIVYDPNVRASPEGDLEKELLFRNLQYADIIKGSDEDFKYIFHVNSPKTAVKEIRNINKSALCIITRGEKGSVAHFKNIRLELPAMKTAVISTIGAGDAFTAGMVNSIIDQDLFSGFGSLSEGHLKNILLEGTKFSAQVCRTMDNYIPTAQVINVS